MRRPARRFFGAGRGSTGFVSIATVVAVVASVLVLLVGSSEKSGLLDLLNGHTWLRDSETGTLSLVNDASGEVEFNLKLTDRVGHDLAITQNGRVAVALDKNAKTYAAVDLARYQLVDPQAAPSTKIDIVAAGRDVYVIDRTNGKVERRDGSALGTVRARMDVGQELTRGVLDSDGSLWITDQRAGLLKAVVFRDERLKVRTTLKVAGRNSSLDLGLVGDTPAVLAVSDGALVFVDGTEVSSPISLPLEPDEIPRMPREVAGDLLPVSVNDTGKIILVRDRTPVVVNLPDRRGAQLREPVVFGNRIYVPDEKKGDVIVLDRNGEVLASEGFVVRPGPGPIDVVMGNGVVYFQPADGTTAIQIDANGRRVEVNKANPAIPTNDEVMPLDAPLPPPPTEQGGSTVTIEPRPPAEPIAPLAQAGPRKIDLSWGAAPERGAPVTGYVITWTASKGVGGTKTIGAQTSTTISNLINGVTYTMSVTAQSAVGPSNAAEAPPATPSSTIPDTPTGVTATPLKDGTITVKWNQADDGTGNWVQYYDVMATGIPTKTVSGGGTTVTLAAADGIVIGTTYTFTVKSRVSPTGTVSPASQPSSAVKSHTAPAAPQNVGATVTASGEITVSWAPCATTLSACDGGETISGYTLTNKTTGDVKSVNAPATQGTFTGLTPGTPYQFEVVANNLVGLSPATPTSSTAYVSPRVTGVQATANGYQSLAVSAQVDTGGAPEVSTEFVVNGSTATTKACSTGVPCTASISGLGWGSTNSVVVRATNQNATAIAPVSSAPASGYVTPAPSIRIWWGASATGETTIDGTKCGGYCKWINMEIKDVWPRGETLKIDCWNNLGGWWGSSGKIFTQQVNGDGYFWGQSGCFFGFPGDAVALVMGTNGQVYSDPKPNLAGSNGGLVCC